MWILRITQTYIEDGDWRINVVREFRSMSLEVCVERIVNMKSQVDVKSQITLRFDGRK